MIFYRFVDPAEIPHTYLFNLRAGHVADLAGRAFAELAVWPSVRYFTACEPTMADLESAIELGGVCWGADEICLCLDNDSSEVAHSFRHELRHAWQASVDLDVDQHARERDAESWARRRCELPGWCRFCCRDLRHLIRESVESPRPRFMARQATPGGAPPGPETPAQRAAREGAFPLVMCARNERVKRRPENAYR